MAKNKQIKDAEGTVIQTRGRPPVDGDRSTQFKGFLRSLDIDKDEWLAEAEKQYPEMIDKIKARWLALQAYRKTVDVIKDWYTENKMEISLANELIRLETDLARHQQLKQEDPAYSAIDDKNYLKAVSLKKDLMDSINKHNVNLAKLTVEAKKAEKAPEDEIVWDL